MNEIHHGDTETETRREIWARKPQIRLVYERWARRIRPFVPDGVMLEVGSGSGLTRDLFPRAILSDILHALWLDAAADCLRLPFRTGSLGCVLVFDTLHHTADPHVFLREAARVLRPGGRIILVEPFITPVSFAGYKLLHHEDVCFASYQKPVPGGDKTDAWQGNLAMANIVFRRQAREWPQRQPSLRIVHQSLMSFFDFQLAAGFKPHAYLPMCLFRRAVRLDDWLGFAMPFAAFRIFIVLEKKSATT
ncbi:MAG: class I SAM-dependent methyltransferase [bacterium]